LACSSFLKLASARARASSDLVVNVVSSFSDSVEVHQSVRNRFRSMYVYY
jgi:hypothetical protein